MYISMYLNLHFIFRCSVDVDIYLVWTMQCLWCETFQFLNVCGSWKLLYLCPMYSHLHPLSPYFCGVYEEEEIKLLCWQWLKDGTTWRLQPRHSGYSENTDYCLLYSVLGRAAIKYHILWKDTWTLSNV